MAVLEVFHQTRQVSSKAWRGSELSLFSFSSQGVEMGRLGGRGNPRTTLACDCGGQGEQLAGAPDIPQYSFLWIKFLKDPF